MDLSKNTTQGLGALALIGILAAAGFLVVKPQVEEAFAFQTKTSEVKAMTEIREARLVKLETENSNIDELSDEVNDLLLRIPSDKNVTDIAGAVVEALPEGVYLESFSHGDLDPAQPSFKAPVAGLMPMEVPFELLDASVVAAPVPDAEGNIPPATTEVAALPERAGAPFIITVSASSFESLTSFIDIMQRQKRLIAVTAITASGSDEGAEATIYAYAFTGSTPKIIEWETPKD